MTPFDTPLQASEAGHAPLRIAVVGHTNVGKTSLLRTLTRRRDFGEVSDRPGVTRHTEAVDLVVQGRTLIEYWDTPGLEDPVALEEALSTLPAQGEAPIDRLQALLTSPLAGGEFEQEAKVIRAMLGALDAAMLVIDCRGPVLPKHRAEWRLLLASAKPVFPVLNHVAAADAQPELWLQALREVGLHAHARFDAVAPFAGAEQALYADLASLLPQRRQILAQVREALLQEASHRRAAACEIAAGSLHALAALSEWASTERLNQPALRASVLAGLRERVVQAVQAPQQRLLRLYGFAQDDVRMVASAEVAGAWAQDAFDPSLLKQMGWRLGSGAAVGAAVGAVADVALVGLSLGTGMALGATVGGIASQGWRPAWTLLRERAQGRQLVRLDDAALCLLAQRWLDLIAALEVRGHANATPQQIGSASDGVRAQAWRARASGLLDPLHRTMAHNLSDGTAEPAAPADVAAVAAWLQQELTEGFSSG